MSNQYQRWDYEPVPARRRRPIPWRDILVGVNAIFAMLSVRQGDWEGFAFSLTAAVALAYYQYRADKDQ